MATSSENTTTADNQFFYEDEVFRFDKKGRIKFGLILENSGSISSDEDDFYEDILYKGEIRIAWHPDGKEEIHKEKDIGLADRTLMPGDVVRRLVPGKDTQRGYCREIDMRADVKIIGTKYVVKNVMAERLKPLLKMPRDNAVCLDSWVGSTKCVKEKVTLKSSCGAIIEVNDLELFQLKDVNAKLRNGLFAETVFYPGQVVTGRFDTIDHFKLLTPTFTLKTNKKGKPLSRKFVVQNVSIEGVWVHWQCKALSEDGSDLKSGILQQPKGYITGDDLKRLKRLNLFESCMLQINDKNYLKISDCDVIVKKSQWEKEQAIKYKLILSQQQKEREENKSVEPKTKHFLEKLEKFRIKVSNLSQQDNSNEKKGVTKSSKQFHMLSTRLDTHSNSNIKERDETEKSKRKNSDNDNCVSDFNTEGLQNQEQQQEEIIKDVKDFSKSNNINKIKIWTNDNIEEWQTDEEEADENDDNSSLAESIETTISSCSSPTPRSSPKRSPLLHKKQMKKFRKSIHLTSKMPEVGEEVVTEALVVYSTATVVWQDGTIETGIPSTQLYPIHHLDDHEFFPGDFVFSGVEEIDPLFRDYGVIQTVDHQGRTARVKWFTTYTSTDEPKPTYIGETDCSVYDLRDHPDFQYRPGTIVIRVANFIGEDATCTAGQIIDNYTDGRVKVWWVDGHISMCWPQDLFEVGQYDPDHNYHEHNESDNDSWETESEISEPGGISNSNTCTRRIKANLEKARLAIGRLEEYFTINPNLQNIDVMRKLLAVYKACRYIDRLMNTSFFHEDNFVGLIERVRKTGNQTRVQDQKNRLFSSSSQSPNPKLSNNSNSNKQQQDNNIQIDSPPKEFAPKVIVNLSPSSSSSSSSSSSPGSFMTPSKLKNSTINLNKQDLKIISCKSNTLIKCSTSSLSSSSSPFETQQTTVLKQQQKSNNLDSKTEMNKNDNQEEKVPQEMLDSFKLVFKDDLHNNTQATTEIINSDMESKDLISNCNSIPESYDDSGNYTKNELCISSSLTNDCVGSYTDFLITSKVNISESKPISFQITSCVELTHETPHHIVGAQLCALLKAQLVKALQEIQKKYNDSENLNLSEVIEYDLPDAMTENSSCGAANNALSELEDAILTIAYKTTQEATPLKINNVTPIKTNNIDSSILDEEILNVTSINSSAATESIPTELINIVPSECFQVLETAPSSHKFHLTIFHPSNSQQYYKAVRHEHKLLRTSLPPGVWVRVFEDRMDLLSVMIEGPKGTPYEDGMFLFDIQLGRDYPLSPPLCNYISYCNDRLNPNLYVDGKVCVSLLGTWTGKDTETWTLNSTLLQVIVSIQGLILVSEPYFNEAGYEKQKGTQQGRENSRMYNEMVIIKLIQSMTKLLTIMPEIFREQIIEHFKKNGKIMYNRIKNWMEMSQISQDDENSKAKYEKFQPPEFPLVPASRGFCLTLSGLLYSFYNKIEEIINNEDEIIKATLSSGTKTTAEIIATETELATKSEEKETDKSLNIVKVTQ